MSAERVVFHSWAPDEKSDQISHKKKLENAFLTETSLQKASIGKGHDYPVETSCFQVTDALIHKFKGANPLFNPLKTAFGSRLTDQPLYFCPCPWSSPYG